MSTSKFEQLKQHGNQIVRLAEQDLPAAELEAQSWLQLANASYQPPWIAVAMGTMARVLKRRPDKSAAIKCQNETIRYIKREQLDGLLVAAYHALGQMHYDATAYYRALDAWLKSLELAGELQDAFGSARAYIGIGKFYYAFGTYTRALECHDLALTAAIPVAKSALLAEIHLNIVADAFRLRDYDRVSASLDAAHHALQTYDRPDWVAEVAFYRGLVCFERNEFSDAQEHLSQAYSLFHKDHNPWGESHVLLALGRTFLKLQEPEHAEDCLSSACELSEKHQLIALGIEAYKMVAFLFLEEGQYVKALQYHRRLHELMMKNQPEHSAGLRLSRQAKARLHSIEGELNLAKIAARLQMNTAV